MNSGQSPDQIATFVNLFGNLVLTFIGFVVPVIGILLSIFQEGIAKLSSQYDNEKQQSENNIKELLKKESKEIDLSKIEESVKRLKRMQGTARWKISILDPKKQLLVLFLPLIFSFLLTLFATTQNFTIPIYRWVFQAKYIMVFVGGLSFLVALGVLWNLFGIIIEVMKIIDKDKKDAERKTIELLAGLLENSSKYFLKKVFAVINNKTIDDNSFEISFTQNIPSSLNIDVLNQEPKMAKNIEIGFIFTPDFIIEKSNKYTIYTDETSQIVRYETNSLQGNTRLVLSPLVITPLKQGKYDIRVFIKAENIESNYFKMKLTIE